MPPSSKRITPSISTTQLKDEEHHFGLTLAQARPAKIFQRISPLYSRTQLQIHTKNPGG